MTENNETVVLTDEEGQEHEFVVIDIVDVDDVEYAVLLPAEDAEEEEGEAVILRIGVDEDGQEVLSEIEDEGEWERVVKAIEALEEEDEAE